MTAGRLNGLSAGVRQLFSNMPNDKILSKEEEATKRASEIEKQNIRLFYGGSEGITADHPSDEYRMSQLQKYMSEAMRIYEQKLQEREALEQTKTAALSINGGKETVAIDQKNESFDYRDVSPLSVTYANYKYPLSKEVVVDTFGPRNGKIEDLGGARLSVSAPDQKDGYIDGLVSPLKESAPLIRFSSKSEDFKENLEKAMQSAFGDTVLWHYNNLSVFGNNDGSNYNSFKLDDADIDDTDTLIFKVKGGEKSFIEKDSPSITCYLLPDSKTLPEIKRMWSTNPAKFGIDFAENYSSIHPNSLYTFQDDYGFNLSNHEESYIVKSGDSVKFGDIDYALGESEFHQIDLRTGKENILRKDGFSDRPYSPISYGVLPDSIKIEQGKDDGVMLHVLSKEIDHTSDEGKIVQYDIPLSKDEIARIKNTDANSVLSNLEIIKKHFSDDFLENHPYFAENTIKEVSKQLHNPQKEQAIIDNSTWNEERKTPFTNRPQKILVSDQSMSAYANYLFQQEIDEKKLSFSSNVANTEKVNRVVSNLADAANEYLRRNGMTELADGIEWKSYLLHDSPNAAAYPGGRIRIGNSILPYMKDEDGLAAILGHEIGHVIGRHTAERYSNYISKKDSNQINSLLISPTNNVSHKEMAGYLASAVEASSLSEVRSNKCMEAEADRIGLMISAMAGYDPRKALTAWQRYNNVGSYIKDWDIKMNEKLNEIDIKTKDTTQKRFDELRKSMEEGEKKSQEQKQAQEQQQKEKSKEEQRKAEQARQQQEQQKQQEAQKEKESKSADQKKSGNKLAPVNVALAGLSLAELQELTKNHLSSLGPTMMGEKTITDEKTETKKEIVQESQNVGHILSQSLFEENMQKIDPQESQTQGIHL
ncbi:MAG: M48 family metallopeptidase [Prevotellaceae bacterium]|nr:M48 family metallopeptidase [Prevotellaceae bacterium]